MHPTNMFVAGRTLPREAADEIQRLSDEVQRLQRIVKNYDAAATKIAQERDAQQTFFEEKLIEANERALRFAKERNDLRTENTMLLDLVVTIQKAIENTLD